MIRLTISRVLRKLANDDSSAYWTIRIPKPTPDRKSTKAIVDGWSDAGWIAPDYSKTREPASDEATRALQNSAYNREARKQGLPQRFSNTPGGSRAYMQDRRAAYLKSQEEERRRREQEAHLAGTRRYLQYHNTQLNRFIPWLSSTPNYGHTTY